MSELACAARDEFIAGYVNRARAVGFSVHPTLAGCIYLADGEDQETDHPMVALPCDCGCNGWGMFDIGGTA